MSSSTTRVGFPSATLKMTSTPPWHPGDPGPDHLGGEEAPPVVVGLDAGDVLLHGQAVELAIRLPENPGGGLCDQTLHDVVGRHAGVAADGDRLDHRRVGGAPPCIVVAQASAPVPAATHSAARRRPSERVCTGTLLATGANSGRFKEETRDSPGNCMHRAHGVSRADRSVIVPPMGETAKLILDGVTYEFPVIVGTEDEHAVDIRTLRAETGLHHARLRVHEHRLDDERDHVPRRRAGHPALPRLSDRGARREVRLRRDELPADQRQAADRGRASSGSRPRSRVTR